MGCVISVKSTLRGNKVHDVIKKIPHIGDINQKMMYQYCNCSCVDIKKINAEFQGQNIKATAIFDDEYPLNCNFTYPNRIASILFGHLEYGEKPCGNILLCDIYDNICIPFDEEKANKLIDLLRQLSSAIDDFDFKV